MINKITIRQRGDTIVEVLIAIAIAGSVLTGAFAISNRSLQQIQMAQEHTEAQKIASSQVEKLDAFIADNPTYVTGSPTPSTFCIDTNGSGKYVAVSPSPAVCNFGVDNRYGSSITKIVGSNNNFQVNVGWDGLNGNPQEVSFTYFVKTPDTP